MKVIKEECLDATLHGAFSFQGLHFTKKKKKKNLYLGELGYLAEAKVRGISLILNSCLWNYVRYIYLRTTSPISITLWPKLKPLPTVCLIQSDQCFHLLFLQRIKKKKREVEDRRFLSVGFDEFLERNEALKV